MFWGFFFSLSFYLRDVKDNAEMLLSLNVAIVTIQDFYQDLLSPEEASFAVIMMVSVY